MHIRDFTKFNLERLQHFKNAKGELAHSSADGSDWSLNDWFTALAGETGEAGNLFKKIRRGDFTLEEIHDELADELADIITYLVILSARAGINLEEATINKWNKVSDKIDYPVHITND